MVAVTAERFAAEFDAARDALEAPLVELNPPTPAKTRRAGGAVNPDLAPHHPRGEGAVFALFVAAMVGYAMLVIYVFGGLLTRAG